MLEVLPPIVAGIFLAAPMSAIMSTVDAQLIQSSSIFVKDLYLASKPEAAKNENELAVFISHHAYFICLVNSRCTQSTRYDYLVEFCLLLVD